MGRVAGFATGITLALATAARVNAEPGVVALDAADRTIDLARSNASIERTPPEPLSTPGERSAIADPDALRFVVSTATSAPTPRMSMTSLDPAGKEVDTLAFLPVTNV